MDNVIKKQAIQRASTTQILQELVDIKKKLATSSVEHVIQEDDSIFKKFDLPFMDLETFQLFENYLQNADNFNKAVST